MYSHPICMIAIRPLIFYMFNLNTFILCVLDSNIAISDYILPEKQPCCDSVAKKLPRYLKSFMYDGTDMINVGALLGIPLTISSIQIDCVLTTCNSAREIEVLRAWFLV